MGVPVSEGRRDQILYVFNIIIIRLFLLFIWFICLGMCYRYIYIRIWIRRVILKPDEELMNNIYSGSSLCPGQRPMRSDCCFGDIYYAPHDTSLWTYITPYTTLFQGLILCPTQHFCIVTLHYKYVFVPASISFSPSQVYVKYSIIDCLV